MPNDLSELEKNILEGLSSSERFLSPYFPIGKLLESRIGIGEVSLQDFLGALRRLEASGYIILDRPGTQYANIYTPVKLTSKGRATAAKIAEY